MMRDNTVNGKSGVISNGKLIVYTNGLKMSEIRGFGSRALLSVIPVLSESFYDTEEIFDTNANSYHQSVFSKRHKLTQNSEKITEIFQSARICGKFSQGGAFVCEVETLSPIRINLVSPPYVETAFYQNYRIGSREKNALLLREASGEKGILVTLCGDARFSENGESVTLSRGFSRMIFAFGEGEERIRSSRIAMLPKYSPDAVKHTSDTPLCDELLHILLSHQSDCGGVLASRNETLFRMDSVRMIVRAFLKYGHTENARALLGFFCERFASDGAFYQIYSAETLRGKRHFCDSALGCAGLASAMLDYAKISGDNSLLKKNIKMMRSALYAQFDALTNGVMPFSGAETELSDSLVSIRSREYASLEATLSFAESVLDFCDYCEENGIKLPHDNGSAARRGRAILDGVSENFIRDGEPSLSSIERKIRLPRFSHGECEICSRKFSRIYYGELELTSENTYACPRCYAAFTPSDERADITEGNSFSTLAAAILLSSERFVKSYGAKESKKMLERALLVRKNGGDMTSVRADCLLLLSARKLGLDADFLESEIKSQAERGRLAWESFDTKTVASLLLALE